MSTSRSIRQRVLNLSQMSWMTNFLVFLVPSTAFCSDTAQRPVRLKRSESFLGLHLVPSGKPLDWQYHDKVLKVRVEQVDIHEILVIE